LGNTNNRERSKGQKVKGFKRKSPEEDFSTF